MPADLSNSENWSREDKLAIVNETAAFNEEEFVKYCRRKRLYVVQVAAARCTVERLMLAHGLQGVVRGRSCRMTVRDDAAVRPVDLVLRHGHPAQPAVGGEIYLCGSSRECMHGFRQG